MSKTIRTIGFLSAAPRVTTRLDSEAGGPRSHILGVIGAFKSLGWQVQSYIVGDMIPGKVQRKSRQFLESNLLFRIISDIARMTLGLGHSVAAWVKLHNKVDWVYERYAVFQAMGWIFQKKGRLWIIETSALYFYEASTERKSIALVGIARLIEKFAYKKCDVLVCVSKALKETIINELGIQPQKIIVVPNGVDCEQFDPAGRTPIRFSAIATIGFVSALVKWHHLEILIGAIAEAKENGFEYFLTVIGDGPMREDWEENAKINGVANQIHFEGQIPWNAVPDYMAGFDLGFIGNDLLEIGVMYHSPLKLYEYMAMGLPVISTEFDDSKNIVFPKINGYLFPASDKAKLVSTLYEAYQDKDKWKKMGENARKEVVMRASWVARINQMILEINQILPVNVQ